MKIDYTLNIIKEKKVYYPRSEFMGPILNSEKKIYEITANNGYGKTFLLNLLAYALFWDQQEDRQILKSLKDSVLRYNNQNNYDLTYDIELDLPDGRKLKLSKETGRDRTIKIDDEPYMNSLNLHKQMNIIYDVPSDPSERLNAVIKDIGKWNNNLLIKLKNTHGKLRELTFKLENLRDEDKINSIEIKISNLKETISDIESQIGITEEKLSSLTLINNLENLLDSYKDFLNQNNELKKSEQKLKGIERPIKNEHKDDKILNKLINEANDIKNEFEKYKVQFINLIHEDEDIYQLISSNNLLYENLLSIKETSIKDIIESNNYVNFLETFLKKIESLEIGISNFIYSEDKSKKYKIHSFLNELLEQIKELLSYEEDILDHISKHKVNEIKSEIERKIKQYEVKNYNELQSFLKIDLKKKLNNLAGEYLKKDNAINRENTKNKVSDSYDKYYRIKGEIDGYKEKLKTLNIKIGNLITVCAKSLRISDTNRLSSYEQTLNLIEISKKGINRDYLTNIKQSIKEFEDTSKHQNNKLIEKRNELLLLQTQLELESKKEGSTYNEYEIKKIELFTRNLGFIIKHLMNLNEIIASLEKDELQNQKINEIGEYEFLKIAGKIIAYSMEHKILRPDGKYLELEYYDLINKEFHCIDDIIIKKEDISTGLASANYLKQRITGVDDGKYVIILLDEIGNMSKDSLDEVIKSIKTLQLNNKLVLALLMQPSSKGIIINTY